MNVPFHFTIDTKEELLLHRQYYADRLSFLTDKRQKLINELEELDATAANCSKMIERIDHHLEDKVDVTIDQNYLRTSSSAFSDPIPPQQPIAQKNAFIGNNLFFEDEFITTNGSAVNAHRADNYQPQLIKVDKAVYALIRIGKEATTREMITVLLQRDPELLKRDDTTFDKYQKALSATLVQKAAAKKIFYNLKTNDGVKYGLLSWRDKASQV